MRASSQGFPLTVPTGARGCRTQSMQQRRNDRIATTIGIAAAESPPETTRAFHLLEATTPLLQESLADFALGFLNPPVTSTKSPTRTSDLESTETRTRPPRASRHIAVEPNCPSRASFTASRTLGSAAASSSDCSATSLHAWAEPRMRPSPNQPTRHAVSTTRIWKSAPEHTT